MIQSATLARTTPAAPVRTTLAQTGAQREFAQSLRAFLDSRPFEPPADDAAVPRQDDADDGKPLPDEDDPDASADPALAWLAALAPPPPPVVAAPPPIPTPPPAAVAPVAPTGATDDLSLDPATAPLLASAAPAESVGAPAIAAPAPGLEAPAPDTPTPAARVRLQVDARTDDGLAATPDPAPSTGPASQVFGPAMRVAASARDDRPTESGGADVMVQPAAAPLEMPHHAVAATGDVQQAPLDMGQSRWPHQMIDRIEHMRDMANASDTRIRLVPDALGTIDVSVRTEGDTVHVRFAAEQAATRTLLTDAQPRLAELAQARGLKIGQSAVDAGTDGQQGRGAPAYQPPIPPAPPRVRAAETITEDIRIA